MPGLVDFWRHLTGDDPPDRHADTDPPPGTDVPADDGELRVVSGAVIARPATTDADWEAVQLVRRRVFHEEQGFVGEAVTDTDDPRSFQAIATLPARPDQVGPRWDGLVVDGRVVVSVGRLTQGRAPGSEATITWVATLPQFRGDGAGAAVVRLMLLAASEAGAPAVRLSSQGHAVRFYQRLGFVTVGAPYEIRGMPHQMMTRWLRR